MRFAEHFQNFSIEGRKVIRFTARDQIVVHDHLLVELGCSALFAGGKDGEVGTERIMG
jgi:hypothetical protein